MEMDSQRADQEHSEHRGGFGKGIARRRPRWRLTGCSSAKSFGDTIRTSRQPNALGPVTGCHSSRLGVGIGGYQGAAKTVRRWGRPVSRGAPWASLRSADRPGGRGKRWEAGPGHLRPWTVSRARLGAEPCSWPGVLRTLSDAPAVPLARPRVSRPFPRPTSWRRRRPPGTAPSTPRTEEAVSRLRDGFGKGPVARSRYVATQNRLTAHLAMQWSPPGAVADQGSRGSHPSVVSHRTPSGRWERPQGQATLQLPTQ